MDKLATKHNKIFQTN